MLQDMCGIASSQVVSGLIKRSYLMLMSSTSSHCSKLSR